MKIFVQEILGFEGGSGILESRPKEHPHPPKKQIDWYNKVRLLEADS